MSLCFISCSYIFSLCSQSLSVSLSLFLLPSQPLLIFFAHFPLKAPFSTMGHPVLTMVLESPKRSSYVTAKLYFFVPRITHIFQISFHCRQLNNFFPSNFHKKGSCVSKDTALNHEKVTSSFKLFSFESC